MIQANRQRKMNIRHSSDSKGGNNDY